MTCSARICACEILFTLKFTQITVGCRLSTKMQYSFKSTCDCHSAQILCATDLCLIQLIILRCGLQLPRWSPNSFKTYMKLSCFPSQAYMPNQTKHESTKVTRTKEHALFSRFASLPCSLRHQGNSCILHKVHGNFLLSYNASTEIQTTES